jgi:hypothetical protein
MARDGPAQKKQIESEATLNRGQSVGTRDTDGSAVFAALRMCAGFDGDGNVLIQIALYGLLSDGSELAI